MMRCCYMMFPILASLSMSSKSSRLSRAVCSKVMSWNMKLKVNSLTISNIHYLSIDPQADGRGEGGTRPDQRLGGGRQQNPQTLPSPQTQTGNPSRVKLSENILSNIRHVLEQSTESLDAMGRQAPSRKESVTFVPTRVESVTLALSHRKSNDRLKTWLICAHPRRMNTLPQSWQPGPNDFRNHPVQLGLSRQ